MQRIRYYKGIQVRDGVLRTPIGHLTQLYRLKAGLTTKALGEATQVPRTTVENFITKTKVITRDHARVLRFLEVPGDTVLRVQSLPQEIKEDFKLVDYLDTKGAKEPKVCTQKETA